jgi:hypothetical protein
LDSKVIGDGITLSRDLLARMVQDFYGINEEELADV